MRSIAVTFENAPAEIAELSARQALIAEQEGQILAQSLCAQEVPARPAKAVAHNAALCAYSLRQNGKRLFASAAQALDGLSLAQLAEYTRQYREAFLQEQDCDECGINERFILTQREE